MNQSSNCNYCNKIFFPNENDYNKQMHYNACKRKQYYNNNTILNYFKKKEKAVSSTPEEMNFNTSNDLKCFVKIEKTEPMIF